MTMKQRMLTMGSALLALTLAFGSATLAGTIIKLNLGGVGPDVSMNAGGMLSTTSDGNAGTTGDQNTAVEYTGFLDVPFADIISSTASYSMSGLQAAGPPQVFGTLIIQSFTGGTFNLYDPANALLLSGSLTNSALTGVAGPPGTGGLFTTAVSTVTGGSLAPYIVPNSLTLSMNLSNINSGAGLSVTDIAPDVHVLNPFVADASVNIAGDRVIPEPATVLLVLMGLAGTCAARRR